MRVLLLGNGDLAEEVSEALEAGGASVRFLYDADDESVQGALLAGGVDVACVAAREDAYPLRMALLIRHRSDVPLVVTIFDPAMAEQVRSTIPDCEVTSVAGIVAPELARACLDRELESVDVRARRVRALVEAEIQGRTFGLLGEPRVNVLKLNLALDRLSS